MPEAADEVFEFLVNLVQLGAQLAQHRQELLARGDGFSARHVQPTPADFKRMALVRFGKGSPGLIITHAGPAGPPGSYTYEACEDVAPMPDYENVLTN